VQDLGGFLILFALALEVHVVEVVLPLPFLSVG
jgi:hypothetical protein